MYKLNSNVEAEYDIKMGDKRIKANLVLDRFVIIDEIEKKVMLIGKVFLEDDSLDIILPYSLQGKDFYV